MRREARISCHAPPTTSSFCARCLHSNTYRVHIATAGATTEPEVFEYLPDCQNNVMEASAIVKVELELQSPPRRMMHFDRLHNGFQIAVAPTSFTSPGNTFSLFVSCRFSQGHTSSLPLPLPPCSLAFSWASSGTVSSSSFSDCFVSLCGPTCHHLFRAHSTPCAHKLDRSHGDLWYACRARPFSQFCSRLRLDGCWSRNTMARRQCAERNRPHRQRQQQN
jgi:hypothetical protein